MFDIDMEKLQAFLEESNRIEGILGPPSIVYCAQVRLFLQLEKITVEDLCQMVEETQPGAKIRDQHGMDVRIGDYLPPREHPLIIREWLETLLVNIEFATPYRFHREFESLHPFMDGNGRAGRILWLWKMIRDHGVDNALALPFLHRWYYQSLSENRT